MILYDIFSMLDAAFLKWCKKYPYARIHEINIHEAMPLKTEVFSEDGLGIVTVRFDRIIKKAGYS